MSFGTGLITSALVDWGSQLHSKTRKTSSAKRRAVVKMWEKLLELVCKKHVPLPALHSYPNPPGLYVYSRSSLGRGKTAKQTKKEKNSIF